MADGGDGTDESQKTEEPSARRLEEARKRGQVVHSREVTTWIVLLISTILIVAAGPPLLSDLRDMLVMFIARPESIPADSLSLKRLMEDLFLQVGLDLLPLLMIIGAAAALSSLIQTGALFTTEPMKPDLSKISPLKGLERLFSTRSLVEFAKGIFKLTIVSGAILMVMLPYMGGVEHYIGQDFMAAMFDMREMYLKMMIAALSILLLLAIADYWYQRHDFMQKMRMSKQELKEEYKQTEGDPVVKQKLRQIREQKARQRMMQAVPSADVVITNPTHFAVALKYDPKEMNAPIMVAKGVDAVAQRIREIAKENKVTIVENAPLARALYDSMELEQAIPQDHFKAVAEVISYVFKLKGKRV